MADVGSYIDTLRAEETSSLVLFRLLFYSILMITLPIIGYFSSKAFLFEYFLGMSSSTSYFYAAIFAIFVIHIILGMFIYVAWKEGSKAPKKAD